MKTRFLAALLLVAHAAWGQTTVIDGLTFSKPVLQNFVNLYSVTDELPATITVPATVTLGANVYQVRYWVDKSISTETGVPASRLQCIRTEDSDGDLRLNGSCIDGWTDLRTIELPAQLTEVDCDFVNNCPALESITFRSNEPVEFVSPYYTTDVKLESHPVLYVQPNLVEHYSRLRSQTDGYAHFFLKQCSDIRPIGGSDTPSGVHLLVGDLHLRLPEARPGDKINVKAPDGEMLSGLTVAGKPVSGVAGKNSTDIVIPDYIGHTVVDVELTSVSSAANIPVVINAKSVRGAEGQVVIDGYDGSEVIVLDIAGRTVTRCHRSRIPLASGTYLVLYGNDGYKIRL